MVAVIDAVMLVYGTCIILFPACYHDKYLEVPLIDLIFYLLASFSLYSISLSHLISTPVTHNARPRTTTIIVAASNPNPTASIPKETRFLSQPAAPKSVTPLALRRMPFRLHALRALQALHPAEETAARLLARLHVCIIRRLALQNALPR
jgi:hypothetical protein